LLRSGIVAPRLKRAYVMAVAAAQGCERLEKLEWDETIGQKRSVGVCQRHVEAPV
jgi:hypothetical protein